MAVATWRTSLRRRHDGGPRRPGRPGTAATGIGCTSMSELVDLTAVEQRRMIGAKQVSATELLAAHLARIDAVNPTVNAIVALDADVGRARARAVDDMVAAGDDPGPLAGLVTAHKDLEDTADFPTTYGSPLFAGHRPAQDCLLVAR